MRTKLLNLICTTVVAITLLNLNSLFAQTFVGSEQCQTCHSGKYNDWVESGHPYKFTIVEDAQPPMYPATVINFQDSWMDSLGDGTHGWGDIAGVIGGFGWKARFVGTDGVIIGTASSKFADAGMGHNQFNFYGGEFHNWSDYDAGTENKIYNYGCFKCHTTGGTTEGTWLEGVEGLGNFTEGGIGCESCHGPGSAHVSAPSKENIDRVYEYAHLDNSLGGLELNGEVITPNPEGNDVNFLCGTCHNRSYTDPINASGGFIKHHEQWDEFVASKHGEIGFDCLTCHDPHKRVIWDGDGITNTCETCHSNQTSTLNHAEGVTCVDCHMPYAAKSGTKIGQSGYRGDVRSHLMSITVNEESMFTEDGSAVRDDEGRKASLSPAYSCLGCHNDSPDDAIPDKTLAQAVEAAAGMHTATALASEDNSVIRKFELNQNYPNPFNPTTHIEFSVPKSSHIMLAVFNMSGQQVATLANGNVSAGQQKVSFNASELPSGVYFYKLISKELVLTKKMVLIK